MRGNISSDMPRCQDGLADPAELVPDTIESSIDVVAAFNLVRSRRQAPHEIGREFRSHLALVFRISGIE